jgi:hypothetical protein
MSRAVLFAQEEIGSNRAARISNLNLGEISDAEYNRYIKNQVGHDWHYELDEIRKQDGYEISDNIKSAVKECVGSVLSNIKSRIDTGDTVGDTSIIGKSVQDIIHEGIEKTY